MLVEHEYRAASLHALREAIPVQRFVALDPGKHGAVLICDPAIVPMNVEAVYPMAAAGTAADQIARRRVKLFVVEAQFLSTNAHTTMQLARRASMLPAFVAGRLSLHGIVPTLLWVQPSTWQARLRVERGKQATRARGKELSLALAERDLGGDGRFLGAGPLVREGIADAYGIAEWMRAEFWR